MYNIRTDLMQLGIGIVSRGEGVAPEPFIIDNIFFQNEISCLEQKNAWSRFVIILFKLHETGQVYSKENHYNRCHQMSYFKSKNAPNSISAGAPGELTAFPQPPSWI